VAVLLVGVSGLAREVLPVLRESGRDVLGVLDDRYDVLPPTMSGTPVLGNVDDVARYPEAEVLICIGSGTARAAIVDRMRIDPARYVSVIDPSVRNPAGCPVGEGSILLAGVTLTADVAVGAHVVAMPAVTIPHDCVIDDFATLASGVSLGGGVHVGRAAYLGMNASVLPGRKIGAGSTVGMGAAVLSDVPDGQTWAGVPAEHLAHKNSGVNS
jgi:sugar O-acyltransferase (sialic acid O-acetyltransferase NeuD family)